MKTTFLELSMPLKIAVILSWIIGSVFSAAFAIAFIAEILAA